MKGWYVGLILAYLLGLLDIVLGMNWVNGYDDGHAALALTVTIAFVLAFTAIAKDIGKR